MTYLTVLPFPDMEDHHEANQRYQDIAINLPHTGLIWVALQVLTKHKQVLPVEPTAEAQVALAQSGTKKHEE